MKYLLLLLLITGKMTLQAQDLKPFKNDDNKWGYKDAKGNEVIAPKYAHAKEFRKGWLP